MLHITAPTAEPIYDGSGKHLGYAVRPRCPKNTEGHGATHTPGRNHETLEALMSGRTMATREALITDKNHPRNFRWSRRGEDCSWKYNCGLRGRTLCKRTRRKPQYH